MIDTIGLSAEGARKRGVADAEAGQRWFVTVGENELGRAYRLAGFLLGDATEAEDAVQDALARAWAERRQLRDPAAAQAWFDRILVNVCRARLRRRRSGVRWVALGDTDPVAPGDPFATFLARESVLGGLAALDADHRIVVVLRFWADLPLEAIAELLRVPVGTVKSRLHYALRDLRRGLRAGAAPHEAIR